jgi:hypothetical protein
MFNFNRWLAKRRLIHRYKYLNEVNKILEEFITFRILQGGSPDNISGARKELIAKQNEIKEAQKLLDFIKKLK